MSEESRKSYEKFFQWLPRFSFALLGLGFLFLLLRLLRFISQLENLAPAEMKLLLEIIKNRFFR